ncbi:hypothetical protein LPJ53_005844 [Coemansia erecta]|uniref:LITAF domain-containing protein n=1 Tax=Coemansia erecta TaxID=147472 RepID=A0A9W7XVR6_9FUNG|nr:hypothetical protein LPJ53_005844 [Coemansia erecta]
MSSYLHRPIGSSFPDPRQRNGSAGGSQRRAAATRNIDSMDCPAGGAVMLHDPVGHSAHMTMPEPAAVPDSYFNSTSNIGREVRQEDLNEPDPLLAATMRDLYEDMAPTAAVRSWNREYIDRAYPHNHNQRAHVQQNQTQVYQPRRIEMQPEQNLISHELPEYSQANYSHSGLAHSPATSEQSDYSPTIFEQERHAEQPQPGEHHSHQDYFDAHHFEQDGLDNSYEHIGGLQRRMPSVHSTSGYGMYGEGAPTGPSAAESLGRQAQTVECPWCHARVTTRIKRRIGFKAGGAAVLVAAIAWPLFWVPLVVPGLHRKTHFCPQCRRKIGRGRRYYQ